MRKAIADAAVIGGAISVGAGLWMLSPAVALVVGGLGVAWLGVALARGEP